MRLVRFALLVFCIELAALGAYRMGWIFMPGEPDQATVLELVTSATRSRSFGRAATPPLDSWRGARVAIEQYVCILHDQDDPGVRYYCGVRLSFDPADDIEYQGMWLLRNRGIQFRLDLDNAETFIALRVDYARPSGAMIDWSWMDINNLPEDYRRRFVGF